MNFKQLWDNTVNLLKAQLPESVNVEAAKFGEMMGEPTTVWVYFEPKTAVYYENSKRDNDKRSAVLNIFVGTGIASEQYVAVCESLALMDDVVEIISELPYLRLDAEPISFDGIYSDKAVMVLEGVGYYDSE
ncbi:MAG: hypothetical protein ABFD61_08550 [Chloroherpetonaceae bacterium]